jgi:hypothetical protein
MDRSVLVWVLFLVGTPAIGTEVSPQKPGQSTWDAMPAKNETAGAKRKPVERKAGEAQKNLRETAKPPSAAPEEKNLGLGCAQS